MSDDINDSNNKDSNKVKSKKRRSILGKPLFMVGITVLGVVWFFPLQSRISLFIVFIMLIVGAILNLKDRRFGSFALAIVLGLFNFAFFIFISLVMIAVSGGV